MIITNLSECGRYSSMSPALKKAFAWLQSTDLMQVPLGRTCIEAGEQGDILYCLHSSYVTKDIALTDWEAHRKYIDIQVLLSGSERIESAVIDAQTQDGASYAVERDFATFEAIVMQQSILLTAGDIAIFFPEDAHKPGIHGDSVNAQNVEKIVVKVAV